MATILLPTVISTIVTNLKGASSLSAVKVVDGIDLSAQQLGDVIIIGHDGSDNGPLRSASSRSTAETLGNLKFIESGVIDCLLFSQDGTSDVLSRRTQAFAMLSAVDTVLRADMSLGGLVMWAYLQDYTPEYIADDMGVSCSIRFTITYQQKI